MGLMGSAFGRALAGGGRAAADIASKYIDAEIERNRMQALADIQRTSAQNTRKDQLQFDTDPNNISARVGAARTSAIETGRTANTVDAERLSDSTLRQAKIEAEKAKAEAERSREADKLEDPRLRNARISDAVATSEGTRDARVADATALEGAKGYDLSPGQQRYVGGKLANENTRQTAAEASSELYREGLKGGVKLPPGVKAEVDALEKRYEQINNAMVKAQADGMWEPDKNQGQKQLQTQAAAISLRRNALIQPYLEGGGGSRDPAGMRGNGSQSSVSTTGEQGARDVEAGKLMINSEYGGDLDKARDALAKLEAEAARSQGDAKQIMQSEANRLRMGIESYGGARAKPSILEKAQTKKDSAKSAPGFMDRATTQARIRYFNNVAKTRQLKPDEAAELERLKSIASEIDQSSRQNDANFYP